MLLHFHFWIIPDSIPFFSLILSYYWLVWQIVIIYVITIKFFWALFVFIVLLFLIISLLIFLIFIISFQKIYHIFMLQLSKLLNFQAPSPKYHQLIFLLLDVLILTICVCTWTQMWTGYITLQRRPTRLAHGYKSVLKRTMSFLWSFLFVCFDNTQHTPNHPFHSFRTKCHRNTRRRRRSTTTPTKLTHTTLYVLYNAQHCTP